MGCGLCMFAPVWRNQSGSRATVHGPPVWAPSPELTFWVWAAGTWTWRSIDTLSCPDNYLCPTFKANSAWAPQVACEGSWREGGQQLWVSVTKGPDCPRAELWVPSQREGAHWDDWNRSWDVGHINKVIFFPLPSPSIYIILHSAHHHYYHPQGLCHVMWWCIELWDWLKNRMSIFFTGHLGFR